MSFLNSRTEIRFTKEMEERIGNIVHENPEQYYNKSHFIRVALMREIRRAKQNGKENKL